MRKFENQVQLIKNQVYAKVSEYAFTNTLERHLNGIPKELNKGPQATLRCCIYHERAVTAERVQLSMGGNEEVKNRIEVLDCACDQCMTNRFVVTQACRGCLSHRCSMSCPVDAIQFIGTKAVIDYDKCIECGKCHESCPYEAISDVLRPCMKGCPVDAITVDENKKAVIDESRCVRCGACVYRCPFGAMQDKSEILPVIRALNTKDETVPVYGIIAPAIATQFTDLSLGQVVTAMKKMGFKDVVEVALGADLVTQHEAEELAQRMIESDGQTYMTSSCCPSFARYIHQEFPECIDHMSTTVTPMSATARLIKETDPKACVVFIGPCVAKKDEEEFWKIHKSVDYVLTVEELTGMISGYQDAYKTDFSELEETPLDNASSFGRGFAASGGVTQAVKRVLQQTHPELEVETILVNGLKECKKVMTQAKMGRLKGVFIEGMACEGGCIKGPVTMHYGRIDEKKLKSYCDSAKEKETKDALRIFKMDSLELER